MNETAASILAEMPDPTPRRILPSLSEPSADVPTQVPVAEADGSPTTSTVREAEAQLILRHTHLKEMLPGLKQTADRAAFDFRAAKDEMEQIVRLLRYHEVLRSGRKRKTA